MQAQKQSQGDSAAAVKVDEELARLKDLKEQRGLAQRQCVLRLSTCNSFASSLL